MIILMRKFNLLFQVPLKMSKSEIEVNHKQKVILTFPFLYQIELYFNSNLLFPN